MSVAGSASGREVTDATKRRAAFLSVAIGLALLVLKTGAWLLTGSVAIFSDALESVVHILAVLFAAFSVNLAAQPEDRCHPYGHGKVEFFSAGIEGLMIVLAAAAIIIEAAVSLMRGGKPQALEFGTLLTASAAVITLWLGNHLVRVGRRTGSLTLEADGKHILTDSYTSFGVVGGLVAVTLTGWIVLDPLIAIAVAVNILWTGGHLMRTAVGGLMDEADTALLDRLTRSLEVVRTPDCIDLHRLRSFRTGEMVHVDAHLMIPRFRTVEEAHALMKTLERDLQAAMGSEFRLLLHLDPCMDDFCPRCMLADCPIRRHPFEGRTAWVRETSTAKGLAPR